MLDQMRLLSQTVESQGYSEIEIQRLSFMRHFLILLALLSLVGCVEVDHSCKEFFGDEEFISRLFALDGYKVEFDQICDDRSFRNYPMLSLSDEIPTVCSHVCPDEFVEYFVSTAAAARAEEAFCTWESPEFLDVNQERVNRAVSRLASASNALERCIDEYLVE
jgi:hypothetical protein